MSLYSTNAMGEKKNHKLITIATRYISSSNIYPPLREREVGCAGWMERRVRGAVGGGGGACECVWGRVCVCMGVCVRVSGGMQLEIKRSLSKSGCGSGGWPRGGSSVQHRGEKSPSPKDQWLPVIAPSKGSQSWLPVMYHEQSTGFI